MELENLDGLIRQVEKEWIDRNIKKIQSAAGNVAKKYRSDIIEQWFSGVNPIDGKSYNAESVNQTGMVKTSHQVQTYGTDYKFQITIETYNDSDAFPTVKGAERWMAKNRAEGRLRSGWEDLPSNIYVFERLMAEQGIIGLPLKSNVFPERGWVNPHPIRREPLNSYMENPGNWSQWQQRVDELMKRYK